MVRGAAGKWRFKLEKPRSPALFASITQANAVNCVMDTARSEAAQFKVHKIVGDGRCMFRATVRFTSLINCHRPLADSNIQKSWNGGYSSSKAFRAIRSAGGPSTNLDVCRATHLNGTGWEP
jgi:hypothetical protein